MKRMKSKLAALLSVSLVLGMALPAYASPVDASGDQATYTVKVENVPAGYLQVSFMDYPEEGNWSNYTRYVLPIDEEVELPAGTSLHVYGNGVYGQDYEAECTSLTVNGEEISSNRSVVVDEDLLISGSFVAYKTENSSTDRIVFENRSTWKNVLNVPTELPLFLRKAGERELTALTETVTIDRCSFYDGENSNRLDEIPFEIKDGKLLFKNTNLTPGQYQLRCSTDTLKDKSLTIVVGYYASASGLLARYEYDYNNRSYSSTYTFNYLDLYDLNVNDTILSKFTADAFDTKLYGHEFSHLLVDDVQVGAADTFKQYYPADDEGELYMTAMYEGYTVPLIPEPAEILERPTQGWYQQNGDWYYYDEDGNYLTDTIVFDKTNKLFYLGADGKAVSSTFLSISAGDEITVITEEEGSTAPIQAVADHDRTYYFGADRAMVTGWADAEDGRIYANPSGTTAPYELAKGLKKIQGKTYYFGDDCYAVAGLQEVMNEDGEVGIYYFDADDYAAITDKWTFITDEASGDLKFYHFTKDGSAQTDGTAKYNGVEYSFNVDGSASIFIDETADWIASPSTASNAAKEAKKALEATVTGQISQATYDTQDKAESLLDKMIDFVLNPFKETLGDTFTASPSEAAYQPALDGTAESTEAKNGFIKKVIELFHTPDIDQEFTATASVALDITGGKNYTPEPVDPTETFTITATAGAGGTIDPSGSVSVAKGEDKTFTIQANNGYRVNKVLVDGEAVSTDSHSNNTYTYTFTKVDADHKIEVSFRRTYTGGSGIGTSGGSSASGAGRAAGATLTPTVGTWVLNQHGQWTMVDPNGNLYRDTWVVYNNQWYYVNADGIMLITWQFINGTWYYFTVTATEGYPVGAMLVNATTPDGYRVDANGAWVQ